MPRGRPRKINPETTKKRTYNVSVVLDQNMAAYAVFAGCTKTEAIEKAFSEFLKENGFTDPMQPLVILKPESRSAS